MIPFVFNYLMKEDPTVYDVYPLFPFTKYYLIQIT